MLPLVLRTAGSPRSTGITPLPRYYGPIRHPLAFDRFPGSPVIRPTFLRRFLAGARRASPVALCLLAIVPTSATPPVCLSASARLRKNMLPSQSVQLLGLRISIFSRLSRCSLLVSARWLARRPYDGFVDGLQVIRFPSCLPSTLRGLWLLPRWDSHPLDAQALLWSHARPMKALLSAERGHLLRILFRCLLREHENMYIEANVNKVRMAAGVWQWVGCHCRQEGGFDYAKNTGRRTHQRRTRLQRNQGQFSWPQSKNTMVRCF